MNLIAEYLLQKWKGWEFLLTHTHIFLLKTSAKEKNFYKMDNSLIWLLLKNSEISRVVPNNYFFRMILGVHGGMMVLWINLCPRTCPIWPMIYCISMNLFTDKFEVAIAQRICPLAMRFLHGQLHVV